MSRRRIKNPHIGSVFDDPDDFDDPEMIDFEESIDTPVRSTKAHAIVRGNPPSSNRRQRKTRDYSVVKPSAAILAESIKARGPTEIRMMMQLHVDTSDMADPQEIGFYNGMAQCLAILTKTPPKYWKKRAD